MKLWPYANLIILEPNWFNKEYPEKQGELEWGLILHELPQRII
jgi:hypothetical protein